jgi:DNA-directed RNA polymerase subunit RPC12/RpoP
MNKLELTSLNCASCGASISDFHGKENVDCDYCGTTNRILRPKPVQPAQGNLSQDKFETLNNYVEILQKAIRAGNYNEGYEYCNKALEIDPSIGAIWENKAICAFWRSVNFLNEDKITNTNAREIKTFLNASKENDPSSDTYTETANAIGSNLFLACTIKLLAIRPDTHIKNGNIEIPAYSKQIALRIKDFIETMETSFDLMVDKDLNVLKKIVDILSDQTKLEFWKLKSNFSTPSESNLVISPLGELTSMDIRKKRDLLISKIKSIDSAYSAPVIKKSATGLVGLAVFLIGLVVAVVTFYSTLF